MVHILHHTKAGLITLFRFQCLAIQPDRSTPREVLKTSYQADLIDDDIWMEMLKIRNQLAHDYDGVIVKEYCQRIVHEYIDKLWEFRKCVEKILETD